ncbi:MAG: hypothetical protein ACK5L5_09885 [Bacteroidales bacterium]
MIESNSDLDNINPDFLKNKYVVRLYGELPEQFIEKFIEKFRDLNYLDIGNKFGGYQDNSFVYNLPNLRGLVISLFKDVDFVLDCNQLHKLEQLHIYVYSKNKIYNIGALNNSLEYLTVTDFNEKDLTKLSSLTNLKSLSFKTAKIKSLKGIETLTNLEYLSLGGVRSLTDISDIKNLQKLKSLEFDICWKLQDFSPIGELKNLELLEMKNCKNLASIKFVKQLPNLKELICLGTTIINDYDTTPAEHVPIFFGSYNSPKYNKHYPEKEIIKG